MQFSVHLSELLWHPFGAHFQHLQMFAQNYINSAVTCIMCIPRNYLYLKVGDRIVVVFLE